MDDEPIKCPKCGSTQIYVDKRGFKTGRAIAGGLITGNLLAAAVAGGIGMGKIEITCLKCGNKFKIGNTNNSTSSKTDIELAEFEKHVISKENKEQFSMYKCECGKIASMRVRNPICPKCGRRQSDQNLYKYEKRSGCLCQIIIPIVLILFILLW